MRERERDDPPPPSSTSDLPLHQPLGQHQPSTDTSQQVYHNSFILKHVSRLWSRRAAEEPVAED